jgi:hypothetical protein
VNISGTFNQSPIGIGGAVNQSGNARQIHYRDFINRAFRAAKAVGGR